MKKTKLTLLFMTLLGFGAIHAQTVCAPGFTFYGYCYGNSLTDEVAFEVCPNAGEIATATIAVGEFETSFDDLTIYEGASGSGTGGAIVFGPADGDVSGNTIDASAPDLCLIFVINSDGSVSCQSSSTIDPLEVCGGSIACQPAITCPAGSNDVPCADYALDLGVAYNYFDISGTGAFVVSG
ncbi:MAG: hypothetical protein R3204_16495, partial [Oceanospirillum sp.]|nr:hypothetical protein [Oceanospirillum sp.]